MSDPVQQIKERLSILDVVGQYVKLTKAGRSWRGLSPFNKEKTPSFFVSPERGFYHCFSSGKGGDMFTFVQEMEGVDFKGALKILAEKAGVELSPYEREAKDDKEKLYAVLEAASGFFEKELEKRTDAREYIIGRGLTEQSLAVWNLGYAPNEWRALSDHLKLQGFGEDVIEKAGLAKKPDTTTGTASAARPYDRFRGRIMFPIRDVSGRIIAFSGRAFDLPKNKDGSDPAKYINSPETPVFIKSSALYGIHHAKEAMKKHGFAIFVEGQMDLLMAHQAGFANTVATSGTALTPEHLGIIKRYAQNLVIAYDGDSAGVAAAKRAALLALTAELSVKIAPMPEGMDPADLVVKEGATALKDTIRHAVHPVDAGIERARKKTQNEPAFAKAIQEEVFPFISATSNKIDQARHIARVAEILRVPEDAVREEVRKQSTVSAFQTTANSDSPTARIIAEHAVSRPEMIEERVYAAAIHIGEAGKQEEAQKIETHLREVAGEGRMEELSHLDETRKQELLFELDIIEEARAGLSSEVADLFRELKRERAREAYEKAYAELRDAERGGAPPSVIEALMQKCNELKQVFAT